MKKLMSAFMLMLAALALNPAPASADLLPGVMPMNKAVRSLPAVTGLPVWKAAVARVAASTGRGKVLILGDSKTLGEGSGNDSATPYDTNAVSNSAGYVMAAQLAAAGIPTSVNGFWGDGGCANYNDVAYKVFNPQLNMQGGATAFPRSGGNQTVGGGVWNVASSGNSGGYFGFNPGIPVTKFRIFTINSQYGYGTYGTQVDSNTLTTVTQPQQPAGTDLVGVIDVAAGAKGSHTLSVNRQSGGTLYVLGGYAWDETTPAIDVLVAGNRGSGVDAWSTATNPGTGWDNYGLLATLAPDLTLIVPPTNDVAGSTPLGTFVTKLTTLVKRMKAIGSDVVIVNAGDTNPATNKQGDRYLYAAAMRSVAAAQQVPFADMQQVYPWNATDWRDDFHERKTQSAREGQFLASFLLPYSR